MREVGTFTRMPQGQSPVVRCPAARTPGSLLEAHVRLLAWLASAGLIVLGMIAASRVREVWKVMLVWLAVICVVFTLASLTGPSPW